MKLPVPKKSRLFFLAALTGLIIGAVLLLGINSGQTAPNESTLVYLQSRSLFSAMLLFLVSILFIVQGIKELRKEKRR